MEDVLRTIRQNSKGFWRENFFLVTLFVVGIMADAASTVVFMRSHGAQAELHPAVYFVSLTSGPVIGPIVSGFFKIASGLLVAIYLRKWAGYILIPVSIISFWAAWYNIWGFEKYDPMILEWFPF